MSKLTVEDDGSATRLAALEACEQRIFIAYRRGLDATCAIAKELVTITDSELWRARDYEKFDDYVADKLHIDGRTADRMIRTWHSRGFLEQAGVELPFNESLIAELSVLPMERQADVWQGLVRVCEREDKPITANTVRKAVEVERDRLAATPAAASEKSAPPAQRRGVQSELHIDDDEETDKSQKAAPAPPRFSDEGERALARIAKHCGDATVKAILSGNVQMTESTVLKWAEQEDVMLRNLRYYLMDLRWHIGRALAHERRLVDGDSTLDQLVLLARVRGGQVTIQHNDFLVSLQQVAAKSVA
jgi:hypothetical protein